MNPPIRLQKQFFIDRKNYVEKFHLVLQQDPKSIVLGDTRAIYGSGKTTILLKLFEELKHSDEWTPLWLALNEFSIYSSNSSISDLSSLEAQIQNLQDYWLLLRRFAQRFKYQEFVGFNERLEEISDQAQIRLLGQKIDIDVTTGSVDFGTWAKYSGENNIIKTGNVHVEININPDLVKWAIENTRQGFTQEFLGRFKKIADNKKFILFADDYCWIIDQHIGKWFIDLVKEMRNAVVVFARTITDTDIPTPPGNRIELELEPFDLEELTLYLRNRIQGTELPDKLVSLIYDFSYGHPLMVCLAADLIDQLSPRDEESILQLLERLFEKNRQHVQELLSGKKYITTYEDLGRRVDSTIEVLTKHIIRDDPLLQKGLDVASIARRFDENLFIFVLSRLILDENGEVDEIESKKQAEKYTRQLIRKLSNYSFFEQLEISDKLPSYRIHHFMRERMEERLISEDTRYCQQLHHLIAQYYIASVEEDYLETADKSNYELLYRLEDERWQIGMMEWLYHLHQIQNRRQARLQFAKIFLVAFDWWGQYLPFRFCEDLIDLWKQTQPDEDGSFIDIFSNFQTAYPTGFRKHGQGDCETVHLELISLLAELDLFHPIEQMTTDERLVFGLIHTFIADALRFNQTPDFSASENTYKKAIEAFFKDEWYKLWNEAFLADLYYDSSNYEQAIVQAKNTVKKALSEESLKKQDHEVISLCYRILGDAQLADQRLEAAISAYCRALVHAYIFPFMISLDTYSMNWYWDMSYYIIVKRLIPQSKIGKEREVLAALQYIRDIWWNGSDFASKVFPPTKVSIEQLLQTESYDDLIRYLLPTLPSAKKFEKKDKSGRAVALQMAQVLKDEKKLKFV